MTMASSSMVMPRETPMSPASNQRRSKEPAPSATRSAAKNQKRMKPAAMAATASGAPLSGRRPPNSRMPANAPAESAGGSQAHSIPMSFP